MKSFWPLTIWLAAAVGAVFLFTHGAHLGSVPGMIEVVEHGVAPLETGRVLAIDVVLGARVKAGDVVARLDTSLIDAEIAVEQTIYEEGRDTIARFQENILQLRQRFSTAIANTESMLNTEKLRKAQAEAELTVMETELKRLENLLQKHLVDEQTVIQVRARRAILAQSVALYPETIKTLEKHLEEARTQEKGLMQLLRAEENGTSSEAIAKKTSIRNETQTRRISVLKTRKETYTLRAPADGTVERIMYRAGDTVQAGTAVLTIVEKGAGRVIGFVPEGCGNFDFAVGTPARVARSFLSSRTYAARVETVDPAVRALPVVTRPIPTQIPRGQCFTLILTEENDLLPGESVRIQPCRSAWSFIVKKIQARKATRTEAGS